MLTIALLTLREAIRRRTPVLSLLVAALLALGAFIPLAGRLLELPRPLANQIFTSIYIYFATSILEFFASIFALALASGAISAELERGTLSSLLPKPITRLSLYAGKWLGLFLFIVGNVLLWDMVIYCVARYREPASAHENIIRTLPYLILYPGMFVTLGLCFSTFASFPLAAGMSILFSAVGWAERMLFVLHRQFEIEMLATLSRSAGFLMPLGRMSRAVGDAMGTLPSFNGEPVGTRSMMGSTLREIESGPWDLPYVFLYALAAFIIGAVVFGRRDV